MRNWEIFRYNGYGKWDSANPITTSTEISDNRRCLQLSSRSWGGTTKDNENYSHRYEIISSSYFNFTSTSTWTGASGVLGSAIFNALRKTDHDTVGLANTRAGQGLLQLDLTNEEMVTKVFEEIKPDCWYHYCWHYGNVFYSYYPSRGYPLRRREASRCRRKGLPRIYIHRRFHQTTVLGSSRCAKGRAWSFPAYDSSLVTMCYSSMVMYLGYSHSLRETSHIHSYISLPVRRI